jgi:3-phosphoshikimate 1-carboxyvinyltransferase
MPLKSISISSKNKLPDANPVSIDLPHSKSLSNRLLILKNLYYPELILHNLSAANDTLVLKKMLSSTNEYNCEDAGTSARFMTARLAVKEGKHHLYGTERMHQRPVEELVQALDELGADIKYKQKPGFLPLNIKGKKLKGGKIVLQSQKSSQFYSSLAMIAPSFEKGLTIQIPQNLNSRSYFLMTLNLMNQMGLKNRFVSKNIVEIEPFDSSKEHPVFMSVEKDWSSAGVFVMLCKLVFGLKIHFRNLKTESLQEDGHFLIQFCKDYDINLKETETGIEMFCSNNMTFPTKLNFSQTPDQAMNFVVTAAILGKKFTANGVETLVLKESNRIEALETELKKIGVSVKIKKNKSIIVIPSLNPIQIKSPFETYHDHRLAMAFALFSTDSKILINNPSVVIKSFPGFWNEWEKTIFEIEELN